MQTFCDANGDNGPFGCGTNAPFNISFIRPCSIPGMGESRTIDRVMAIAAHNELSQAQLARLLDISEQTLTNWKRRGMPPRMDRAVAERLGVEIARLYDADGRGEQKPGIKITADTTEEVRLLSVFRRMQKTERDALILVATALSAKVDKSRGPYPFKKAQKKQSRP